MNEYKKLKSTPGMWIVYFVFLAILVTISVVGTNMLLNKMTGDALSTKVFTVGKDAISIKIPDNWSLQTTSTTDAVTWVSDNGYESLSISSTKYSSVTEASVMYMLEIQGMFPDASMENFDYKETEINGKKMFAMHILYDSRYYLCGVKESGNTIIKFVYSASAMIGEISDIDTIIGSINYRVGDKK